MARSIYFLGGLFAMALVMMATVDLAWPWRSAPPTRGAAPPAAVSVDPAVAAIDDLAAWPAGAGR
jgi:hypothetical protein